MQGEAPQRGDGGSDHNGWGRPMRRVPPPGPDDEGYFSGSTASSEGSRAQAPTGLLGTGSASLAGGGAAGPSLDTMHQRPQLPAQSPSIFTASDDTEDENGDAIARWQAVVAQRPAAPAPGFDPDYIRRQHPSLYTASDAAEGEELGEHGVGFERQGPEPVQGPNVPAWIEGVAQAHAAEAEAASYASEPPQTAPRAQASAPQQTTHPSDVPQAFRPLDFNIWQPRQQSTMRAAAADTADDDAGYRRHLSALASQVQPPQRVDVFQGPSYIPAPRQQLPRASHLLDSVSPQPAAAGGVAGLGHMAGLAAGRPSDLALPARVISAAGGRSDQPFARVQLPRSSAASSAGMPSMFQPTQELTRPPNPSHRQTAMAGFAPAISGPGMAASSRQPRGLLPPSSIPAAATGPSGPMPTPDIMHMVQQHMQHAASAPSVNLAAGHQPAADASAYQAMLQAGQAAAAQQPGAASSFRDLSAGVPAHPSMQQAFQPAAVNIRGAGSMMQDVRQQLRPGTMMSSGLGAAAAGLQTANGMALQTAPAYDGLRRTQETGRVGERANAMANDANAARMPAGQPQPPARQAEEQRVQRGLDMLNAAPAAPNHDPNRNPGDAGLEERFARLRAE